MKNNKLYLTLLTLFAFAIGFGLFMKINVKAAQTVQTNGTVTLIEDPNSSTEPNSGSSSSSSSSVSINSNISLTNKLKEIFLLPKTGEQSSLAVTIIGGCLLLTLTLLFFVKKRALEFSKKKIGFKKDKEKL